MNKVNKYFSIIILILIIWLTGNMVVTFASSSWEAEREQAIQEREMLLKQVEALNMQIEAIEAKGCREKLAGHYSGTVNMNQSDIDRCRAKVDSPFQ